MLIKVPKKEEMSPKPICDGAYQVQVSKIELRRSDKGNNYFNVELNVASQGPDLNEKTIGRKVFDNVPFTNESIFRTNAFYKACTGNDLPEGDHSIEELAAKISSMCIGAKTLVILQTETYLGIARSKVKEYRKLG